MALYVNGEAIEEARVEAEMARLKPRHDEAFAAMPEADRDAQLLSWSRENVIEQVLLRQAALADPEPIAQEELDRACQNALGAAGPEMDEAQLREAEETRLRVERLIERLVEAVPEPDQGAVFRFYNENLDGFHMPPMAHAKHIVRHAQPGTEPEALKQELEEVRQALRDGADWDEMAQQHSDCPENGGDLGFFPQGHMVPRFEEVVFRMKPGELSGVIETEFGFHLITLIETRPPGPAPFEEAQDTAKNALWRQLRDRAVEQFLDDQKAKAVVEEK